ncbi:MAG TPA: sigma-54 dependent transcriptional regulator, partial [Terriglobales bacterium]|nr:sigma-54 dependent transcriptional regulator [Terriglobales bacterium]
PQEGTDPGFAPGLIFGASAAMQQVRRKLERIGDATLPVLITGESGTGKELLARRLHLQSRWSAGPFVKVHCPAIPAGLLESELFGYERGAFTGANQRKPGRIDQAEGGTLFLDEVGELELGLQAKLLQVLQDGRYTRLGSAEERCARARMLFATNRRLEDEVAAGRFRRDLYYRMNVVGMEMPCLRQRPEDIAPLARHFLREFARRYQRPQPPLPPEAVAALCQYSWPGNVRELEHLLQRYVIVGNPHELLRPLLAGPRALPARPPAGEAGGPLKAATRLAVQKLERDLILEALANHHWHRKRTAQALGISYRALLYKLRAAGVPPRSEAAASLAAGRRRARPEDGDDA